MNTTSSSPRHALPGQLQTVLALAGVLQRLEASREPVSPEQYRSVVTHLADALGSAAPGEVLDAILSAHPAAADLYENLHYEHAGLCRSHLEPAMRAELSARDLLGRLGRVAAPGRKA